MWQKVFANGRVSAGRKQVTARTRSKGINTAMGTRAWRWQTLDVHWWISLQPGSLPLLYVLKMMSQF